MFTIDCYLCCIAVIFFAFLIIAVTFTLTLAALKLYISYKKLKYKDSTNTRIGIFHPYCNAGGGGERVLWCAVKALLSKYVFRYITLL